MKKRCIIFIIILSTSIMNVFSQNVGEDFCKFTVKAGSEINTGLKVSMISIKGVSLNIANKILKLINIKKGDELSIHPDSLCNRLKNGRVYKTYYLSSVEFYRDSISEIPNAGAVRFTFEKIKK